MQQSEQVLADRIRLEQQLAQEDEELNNIKARLNEFDQERDNITVIPIFVSDWSKRETDEIQEFGSRCRRKARAGAEGTFTSSTTKRKNRGRSHDPA